MSQDVDEVLARRFEGCRLVPHLCPAGVPSIGYGTTHYEDGTAVRLDDQPISHERAVDLLRHHLETVSRPAVRRLMGQLSSRRHGAMSDFVYNLGAKNLQHSTLRRKALAGQWEDVPAELMRWTRGGGRVLKGLVLRRQAEADLV